MAESADDPSVFWVDPERRGVIQLDEFHVSRRLARTVRSDRYRVTMDTDFDGVIEGCSSPTAERPSTWINESITTLFRELFNRGMVHTIECWDESQLVGGLYGVSLGAVFFGESMFSRKRDASKIALVHLVARLIAGGYTLLDTQFVTDHLISLGAREISRATYHQELALGLSKLGNIEALPTQLSGAEALQLITQTS